MIEASTKPRISRKEVEELLTIATCNVRGLRSAVKQYEAISHALESKKDTAKRAAYLKKLSTLNSRLKEELNWVETYSKALKPI